MAGIKKNKNIEEAIEEVRKELETKELVEESKETTQEDECGRLPSIDEQIIETRALLRALDEFYDFKKKEYEKEIRELENKKAREEMIETIRDIRNALTSTGIAEDQVDSYIMDYMRQNTGLPFKSPKITRVCDLSDQHDDSISAIIDALRLKK